MGVWVKDGINSAMALSINRKTANIKKRQNKNKAWLKFEIQKMEKTRIKQKKKKNITKTGCGGEVLEVAKKVKMWDMTRAIGSTRKKERKKKQTVS